MRFIFFFLLVPAGALRLRQDGCKKVGYFSFVVQYRQCKKNAKSTAATISRIFYPLYRMSGDAPSAAVCRRQKKSPANRALSGFSPGLD
jgi:hypothetical protein